MLGKIIFTFLLLTTLVKNTIAAPIDVSVGGYLFPPFVYNDRDTIRGISLDLIELLNKSQSKYNFVFHLTSSKRRYKDFGNNEYSLIFFEDIKWGWKKKKVVPSDVILKGGEVFIAHASKGRGQEFFKDLKNKRILGILGYHYKFANFNADREFLNKNYNVDLRTNHLSNIHTIAKRDLNQVAIVTKSLLKQFFKENPVLRSKILVSDNMDQEYRHTILIRENSKPTKDEINKLIKNLYKNGSLKRLWKKYGIEESDQVSF
jgi:ABC-type amino acid transport substrate-binding protein